MTTVCRITLSLLALAVTALPSAATEFPFNGGFEQVSAGQTLGWEATGTWTSLTQQPYEGRRCAKLFSTISRAGDRLVNGGYRLFEPGETLTLSLAYRSAGEGAVAGLVPCDALGQPLPTDEVAVPLPPAEDWTTVTQTFTVPKPDWPPHAASVRVFVGVDRAGAEVYFDSVRLEASLPAARSAGAIPQIDARHRADLLGGLRPAADELGGVKDWLPLVAPGFLISGVEVDWGESGEEGALLLQGQDTACAWLSAPVVVDASLPHVFSAAVDYPLPPAPPVAVSEEVEVPEAAPTCARVSCCAEAPVATEAPPAAEPAEDVADLPPAEAPVAVPPAEFSALIRLLDSGDPRNVMLQQRVSLEAGPEPAQVAVRVDKLGPQRQRGLVQVGLALEPGRGTVRATTMALRPEPVTLTIRPVAGMTEFPAPKDVTLFVMAVNNTAETLNPVAHLKVVDLEDDEIAYEPRRVSIGPQSAAYFPYRPTLPGAGSYRQLVRLMEQGQDLGFVTFDFLVLGE